MKVVPIRKAVLCPYEKEIISVEFCRDCISQHGYAFAKGSSGTKFGPICEKSEDGYEPVMVPTLNEEV